MFWVSGKGWVKARDLQEGMRLHAVEGTAEVRSVHPTGAEETHNLVVADFHTYFATKDMLLTHDNTIREPVDQIVPGLARRRAPVGKENLRRRTARAELEFEE
jgi:hypothetical protein